VVAAGAPGWFGDGPPDRDGGEVRKDFVVDVVGEGESVCILVEVDVAAAEYVYVWDRMSDGTCEGEFEVEIWWTRISSWVGDVLRGILR